jgi:arginase
MAILWVDSHPDMGTGTTACPGFHAMVVSALTGHGDSEVLELLPATTSRNRVALVGRHVWTVPALPDLAEEWGLTVFPPDTLRTTSAPLLDWLGTTGVTKIAITSTSTPSTPTRFSWDWARTARASPAPRPAV